MNNVHLYLTQSASANPKSGKSPGAVKIPGRTDFPGAHVPVLGKELGKPCFLRRLSERAQWCAIHWRNANRVYVEMQKGRGAIKSALRASVTSPVVCRTEENVIDPAEKLISKRLEEEPLILAYPPNTNADRDRAARYLKLIQCNTIKEVLAAEQRAKDILTAKNAQLKAVAARLVEHGFIDRDDLAAAVGK